MNIIIPMAGRGSRLRPHTLTTPKPLISFVGKSIVQRLVEDIVNVCDEKINEMVQFDGPVIFDCRVDPNENCFPMIPSGKPHNQMILGPSEKEENKITGKGKALV